MRLLIACTLAAALLAPDAAHSQKPRVPKRPANAATDTNSTQEYFRHALRVMESDPAQAADALYWALRLEPTAAATLYAARVANLRADERQLIRYVGGDRRAWREMAPSDTLLLRARMLDPFLLQDQDRPLLMHYFRAAVAQDVRRAGGSAAELRYEIDRYVDELMRGHGNHAMAGSLAMAERRYPEALDRFAKAIGKKHDRPDLHEERATAFYLMQNFDSTITELEHAVAEMKKEEKKEESVVYRSKAMLHHKIGVALLRKDDLDGARTAFGRALEEDLAFYPAHVLLASIALIQRDSATAVHEMGLAVELAPADPWPYMRQADLLQAMGDHQGAIVALTRVVEMEPYYAEPRRLLGKSHEALGNRAEAAGHYRDYLARSIRRGTDRPAIESKIRILSAEPPPGGGATP